jgi:predicted phosphodiesterase
MKLTEEEKQGIYDTYVNSGKNKSETARLLEISRSTVRKVVGEFENDADPENWNQIQVVPVLTHVDTSVEHDPDLEPDVDADQDLVATNVKLAKKVFQLQDLQRVERKAFREHSRVDNMILKLHEEMKTILEENSFSIFSVKHDTDQDVPVGIVQLSDVHFNELIHDLDGNQFNFEIASQRLHKLIRKAKVHFKASGVTDVALCLTGDLMNSDRRLDEITAAATNRSRAVFLAVDIVQQVILDLNTEFNVTVASVTGNESRVGEHVHYSDFLAGDSYDMVIHNMLTYLFKDAPGVSFVPVVNPLECVINVNGNNILLVHGHVHKGIAANPVAEVEKIKARYANRGILVSYVLMGHIHCAQVSDLYARSSGLPGTNSYAERALNLAGRASQNVFLVYPSFGEIDGIKVDLQNVESEPMYEFDTTLASYQKKQKTGTVVIQSVVI